MNWKLTPVPIHFFRFVDGHYLILGDSMLPESTGQYFPRPHLGKPGISLEAGVTDGSGKYEQNSA